MECRDDERAVFTWRVRGRAPRQGGAWLLGAIVRCCSVCLRRAACGKRASIIRANRFLANPRVTVSALIEGWGVQTAHWVGGRHILAIQDTSEIGLQTTASQRRGLGLVGCGNSYGLMLHAMLAVDAESHDCLGLVSGEVWSRDGRVPSRADDRPLSEKESNRWGMTAQAAKVVLSTARRVTVVGDRESDIYADWSRLPEPGFDLLLRSCQNRRLAGGGWLHTVSAAWPTAGTATIQVPVAIGTPGAVKGERPVALTLRHGPVELRRPDARYVAMQDPDLSPTVAVHLVEVVETDPPPDVEPVHWRLLTTHAPTTAAEAWQIVEWYKARWIIEQMFRLMKSQGLGIEDTQVESAERLLKLTAIAAAAATRILQLVQARDGQSSQPAEIAFDKTEIKVLETLHRGTYRPRTPKQTNPHQPRTLAWAAWLVARLGGWDGYASSRKPGPITFITGYEKLQSLVQGWSLRDV